MRARCPCWSARFLIASLVLACTPALARAADELDLVADPVERMFLERDLARDRFEVSQKEVKDLARRREEAIRESYFARREEYLAGRGTLDWLLEAQNLYTDARQPLRAKVNGSRAALEELWRFRWLTENRSRFHYESGQVKAGDYFMTLYHRLDTEVNLVMSRPKKK